MMAQLVSMRDRDFILNLFDAQSFLSLEKFFLKNWATKDEESSEK